MVLATAIEVHYLAGHHSSSESMVAVKVDRFRLFVEKMDRRLYLMAWYEPDHSGIIMTSTRTDACQYATIEKAASVARDLNKLHGYDIQIEAS